MKKKLTLVVTCIVLVAAMVIGGTLAYFTDTKKNENTFTIGNVMIKLDEAVVTKNGDKWTASETDRTTKGNAYEAAYPGAEMPKDPTVHNVGKNAAYIRAKVTMTDALNTLAVMFPAPAAGTNFNDQYIGYLKQLVGGNFGEGWTCVDINWGPTNNGSDLEFVFEYDGTLAPEESTNPIFEKIVIPSDFDTRVNNGTAYLQIGEVKLDIVAEAIQADGFDTWAEAFNAFDGN